MLAQHKMQTTLAALAKCRVLFWRMKVGLERAPLFLKKESNFALWQLRHLASCWKTSQPLLASNK